ncbi:MAG TPA: hypothetical protein VIH17_13105 [Candidatus Acidoferrales bacterium]
MPVARRKGKPRRRRRRRVNMQGVCEGKLTLTSTPGMLFDPRRTFGMSWGGIPMGGADPVKIRRPVQVSLDDSVKDWKANPAARALLWPLLHNGEKRLRDIELDEGSRHRLLLSLLAIKRESPVTNN